MKKAKSSMKDMAGRALKRTTADAKGRAMTKKMAMGGMAMRSGLGTAAAGKPAMPMGGAPGGAPIARTLPAPVGPPPPRISKGMKKGGSVKKTKKGK